MKKYKWEEPLATCYYESRAEFLWLKVMGGCGCGNFNEEEAWKVFSRFKNQEKARWEMYDEDKRHLEILAHWMNSLDLIEHGSSIAGSWLSEEGEALWDALHSDKYVEKRNCG